MPVNTGPVLQLPPIPSPDATPEAVREWSRQAGIAISRAWQQLYDDIAGGSYVYNYISTDGGGYGFNFNYGQVVRARLQGDVPACDNGVVTMRLLDDSGYEIGRTSAGMQECYILPNQSATSAAAFLPRLSSDSYVFVTPERDDKWYLICPTLILKGNADSTVGATQTDTTAATDIVGTCLTAIGKW